MSGLERDFLTEKPRRFYGEAAAAPAGDGWAVKLDGRGARTPGGAPLALPTRALAELVAGEWNAQAQTIDYGRMPVTRLAFTTLDRAAEARAGLAAEAARYAGADLLCYRAEAPQALVEQEAAAWDPPLDWAEAELGLRFVRAAGVVHRPQPPQTLERVRALAEALDDFALTGLTWGAGLLGSAVLALAVLKGELDGVQAFELSRLDEAYQASQWGEDAEAAERTARLRGEAAVLQAWFEALRPKEG